MIADTDGDASDFSIDAFLQRGGDFLFLLMLAALFFFGLVYAKRRGGVAPRVVQWSGLVCLVVFALPFVGSMALEALRSSTPPRETPEGPVTYEAWAFLDSLAVTLWGLAFGVCGVAFVWVGWGEGAGRSATGKRKTKTKTQAKTKAAAKRARRRG